MKRHNVNKRNSAKKFNKGSRKTARANLMIARGGYRL